MEDTGLRGCRPAPGGKSRDPGEASAHGSRHRSRCAAEPTGSPRSARGFPQREKSGNSAQAPQAPLHATCSPSGQPLPGLRSGRHAGPSPGRSAGPHRVPAGDTHRPAGPGAPRAPSARLERTPSKRGSAVCKLRLHGADF